MATGNDEHEQTLNERDMVKVREADELEDARRRHHSDKVKIQEFQDKLKEFQEKLLKMKSQAEPLGRGAGRQELPPGGARRQGSDGVFRDRLG